MQSEIAIRFRVTSKMRSLLDRLRDEEDINVSVVDHAAAHNPNVPHHDLDDEAEIRHLRHRLPAHRNRRALRARSGRNEHPAAR